MDAVTFDSVVEVAEVDGGELVVVESTVEVANLGVAGPAGVGVPAGGSTNQVLAKASGANYDTAWVNQSGGGGGASALDDLSDVTITSPASGAALVYNGSAWVDGPVDLADSDAVTGVLPDANIASTIARDSEVTAAIAAHAGETDPHTGYLLESDAPELIRDTMGTALVAGSNVTITPNDGADTITIASTGGVTDHGALTGLSDDDHPQYVLNTGDTLTGGLLVTGAAATQAFRTLVTAETNDRIRVLADGQVRIIGRDNAGPTYTGVNRPLVFLEALGGQSSTVLVMRGSSDTTNGNMIFRAEDYLGAPIAWLAYAGGFRITDAMLAVNGVFTVTEQAGFAFRNTNGSGAILSNLDTLSLVFGVSSRVWSGDLVPASKQLGLNISRSSWSFTGSITNGSNVVTVVSGLPDARSVPIGSVLTGITGIPNSTTVTATTSSTITLSANATATNASLTVRIFEPDTLAIRAYNGVEIHGRLTGSDTAAGKVLFDGGLVLSGDNDTDGWKISTNDKNLLPPASGAGGEIGSSSNRLRRLWTDIIRVHTSILPRSGQSIVIGDTTDPISQVVVNDIQGTVNDGWVLAPTAWTRVSDTQFTISSATNLTSRYQKGTRLRWVDSGGTKYGVVASSSFASSTTTVNLITTSDFVMASSPATGSRWYSHQASPEGFPTWFNYTPSLTGWSSSPTTSMYRWRAIGKSIVVAVRQGVATASNTTTIRISAPVQCDTTVTNGQWGTVFYNGTDNSVNLTTPGRVIMNAATGASSDGNGFNVDKDLAGAAWTNTNNKRVQFVIEYEF